MSGGQSRQHVKSTGRHFTPPELAAYLARLAIRHRPTRLVDVFDPACGDGALLEAVLDEIGSELTARVRLVGVDLDSRALQAAAARLESRGVHSLQLRREDFLGRWLRGASEGQRPSPQPDPRFDLIIANPPYVRTQVLGAPRSRVLAQALGLSGRVDLYQAFVRAMTPLLRPRGVLALLCPNRFMITRSGAAMRDLLLREYQMLQIVDLGDTGLFRAAVLPAILIARKQAGCGATLTPFVRIVRSPSGPGGPGGPGKPGRPGRREALDPTRLLDALDGTGQGPVRIDRREFHIDRGEAQLPADGRSPWSLLSPDERRWIAEVGRHTHRRFEDLVRIHVGVKTTADAVFIRDDWNSLPADQQPEADLLRPLLTHRDAATYVFRGVPAKTILYPHTTEAGRRRPIDLRLYPRARKYLEQHQQRLAARRYVVDAGREWFELWVPHHPERWSEPKIVAPDISAAPLFAYDRSGAVVNGDCYWLSLRPDQDPRAMLLILAVANSSLATRFYDNFCSNRLYSGRRRYITQYLNSFPVPDPDAAIAARIMRLVQRRLDEPPGGRQNPELELEIDRLVDRAFGVCEQP